jgi:hypothetical protein
MNYDGCDGPEPEGGGDGEEIPDGSLDSSSSVPMPSIPTVGSIVISFNSSPLRIDDETDGIHLLENSPRNELLLRFCMCFCTNARSTPNKLYTFDT